MEGGRGERGRGRGEGGEGKEGEEKGGEEERKDYNVISLKAFCAHNILHLSSPLKGLVLHGI